MKPETNNLYHILGLDKDATTDDILKAYRLLVKKHHPDRGGDPDTFKQIQEAYDILMDEDKRAHYDKTGKTKQQKSSREIRIMTILLQIFERYMMTVLSHQVEFGKVNMVKQIESELTEYIVQKEQQIPGLRKIKAKLLTAQGRFLIPEEEDNCFEGAIKAQIEETDKTIADIKLDIEVHKEALALLRRFQYRMDDPGWAGQSPLSLSGNKKYLQGLTEEG